MVCRMNGSKSFNSSLPWWKKEYCANINVMTFSYDFRERATVESSFSITFSRNSILFFSSRAFNDLVYSREIKCKSFFKEATSSATVCSEVRSAAFAGLFVSATLELAPDDDDQGVIMFWSGITYDIVSISSFESTLQWNCLDSRLCPRQYHLNQAL